MRDLSPEGIETLFENLSLKNTPYQVALLAYLDFFETLKSDFINNQTIKGTFKKVSEILELLSGYKKLYCENGILPNLDDGFELNLFNTFICYRLIPS